MRLLLIFCIISLMLLCGTVCELFAKAPTSPKILFTSSRNGNSEVYMMNPDGSEQVNLTQHRASDFGAVWSPTGEQILFVSDRQGTRVRDLYLMDADGTNVRRVFKRKIEARRTSPTWSPDRKQFAYWSVDWNRAQYGLYLGTFGEEDAEPLPYGNSPAWSPDGKEIACSVSHPKGSRLTFLNVRTREREQPLPDKVLLWQWGPSWSAAGDRIAFTGNKHPLPVILDRDLHNAWKDRDSVYIVNRDGTGLRQLVDEAGPAAGASALSPDGEEVIYTQEINGHLQIFKIEVNSGVRTQLTHVRGPFRRTNYGADWFDPAYTRTLPVSPQSESLTTTWGQMKME